MRLAMFQGQGDPRLGAVQGGAVVDLNLAYEAMLAANGDLRARAKADAVVPSETVAFLQGGEDSLKAARTALKWAAAQNDATLKVRNAPVVRPLKGVKLLAPVMKPEKIICVAHNYHDFLKELGMKPHPLPRIFSKFANAVCAWDDPVIRPRMSRQLGYEAELAFVIGKRCKNVPEEKAYDVIAGYMTFNDISASDCTKSDVQNTRGKGFDTFAPMGPCLVTADEVADPHDLKVELRVNGRVLQSSNTRELVHNVPQLLSFCSQVFTLEPGDVVATGTPGGLAKDRNPPTFMEPGDVMETEIGDLGLMRNPIVEEED
ncbi:MAG: fumarylacetoacetate hydrolase family protein [Rhodospirillales bacterium]|nr:fumarylacetoacetate hydrolase family protein [Rhodospirillales bacterium]